MLLHIAPSDAVDADWKLYAPNSLEREGFIHCSTVEQILGSANRFYAGETDLRVLVIDPRKLTAEVRWENLEGGTMLFPHIYGPLNRAAVVESVPLFPEANGRFEKLPAGLAPYPGQSPAASV